MNPETGNPAPSSALTRDGFSDYIYTPIGEALEELARRERDTSLKVSFPVAPPSFLLEGKNAVLFRHFATPNHETARFVSAVDVLSGFRPIVLEYLEDKFNDRNEWKHFAGKLRFNKGRDRHGNVIVEQANIINFNDSNNKPLSGVRTLWGDLLVDFHHALFLEVFPHMRDNLYDFSGWLKEVGPGARDYYVSFFKLFVKHNILFENFLLDGKEGAFTDQVVLPAFKAVVEETGCRPLIVPLEPTEMESDQFWFMHPYTSKEFLHAAMGKGLSDPAPDAKITG